MGAGIIISGDDKDILTVGETIRLTAEVFGDENASQEVTWSTSKPTVATVDQNGVVTAHAPGEVIISAKSKQYDYAVDIVSFEVNSPIVISNASNKKLKLNEGQEYQLNYTIISNKISVNTITWDVVDDDIAVISSNGNITARKAGNTKVKVYLNGNPLLCDEIELSVCLIQKSYIFYTDYDDDDLREELVKRDKKNLADKYYGGDTSKIELKLIKGKTDFKDYWNDYMGTNLGYVIINCIGKPDLLENFNSNDSVENSISVQEIKRLREKKMKGLILLSCNAGHLDYVDVNGGNVAMAFSTVAKETPIFASDGSVISSKLENYEYENKYNSAQDGPFLSNIPSNVDANARYNNSGWKIYKYSNKTISYSSVDIFEYLEYGEKIKY